MSRTYVADVLFWVALALVAAVLADVYVSARTHKRNFTVLAVEPKGAASFDKGPFPAKAQSAVARASIGEERPEGPPANAGNFVWHPSRIVVEEGEEVTLDFAGINGDEHPTTIAAFGQTFTVRRGELTRVTFVADKIGIFGYVCSAHSSMSGELIVLPRSKNSPSKD